MIEEAGSRPGRVRLRYAATVLLAAVLALSLMGGCGGPDGDAAPGAVQGEAPGKQAAEVFNPDSIPVYSGEASVQVNGGVPYFTAAELTLDPRESYSELDSLGRCGPAIALVGPETMPQTPRGSIGEVKPSGWHASKYDWVDGKYLFNRCHLIAYALAGENANPLNLITGTRSMNAVGMLPYEERVAAYIDATGNHVLYRVTPVFSGDDLVAAGVLMEAQSIEDSGEGIRFCAWCYNVEDGVAINYATGDNWTDDTVGKPASEDAVETDSPSYEADSRGQADSSASASAAPPGSEGVAEDSRTFILNTNTHRFHFPDRPSVSDMKERNKQVFEGSREEAITQGYEPCSVCQP